MIGVLLVMIEVWREMYIEGINVYASTESVCSSSNFGRARRMFIFNAAVSANLHVSVKRLGLRYSRLEAHTYRLSGHAR
jgi:hypothetical protein